MTKPLRMATLLAATFAASLAVMPMPAAAQSLSSSCGTATTVRAGDTLFSIAQRCGVPLIQITRANPGIDPRFLRVGQTVRLAPQGTVQPPASGDMGYQIRPGDTLQSVADRFGISPGELVDANPTLAQLRIDQGQIVVSPETPSGGIEIMGILTNEGVECPTLRADDGQLYSLSGDLEGFEPGDEVTIRGAIAQFSFCMQGTTIAVEEIVGG